MTSSDLVLLSIVQINDKLGKLSDWNLENNGKSIMKNFQFKDFKETVYFFNKIAEIAEQESHFPDLRISNLNNLEINLTTYSANGLTSKDFEIAFRIEEMANQKTL